MNEQPLVSILMPAFNAEKFIGEAIESILEQDYSNWELLILNDASTDSTQAIIASFTDPRIQVFQHKENRGYLLSCNELFEKAAGEFVTFLDADDTCSTNRLSICINAFQQNPKIGFLTTGYDRVNELGIQISKNELAIDYIRYRSEPSYAPTICCATIFVRRQLLEHVGGYRSFFEEIGGEDYFWLWELARTYSGVHLSDTIYHYRQHTLQTSLSHKNDLYLFLPELLKELKIAFLNQPWHNAKAALVKEELSSTLVSSAFELNLRRSEQAINRKDLGFSGYAFRTLINIRKPGQTKRLGYLLYSWLAKQLRSQ